jgi:N6-L-threonylcarbamoyladenine synthase
MRRVFLGIDTSCYTTSVALLDESGQLLADERKLLNVGPGQRGLSQSEMVFQHTRNLPGLLREALAEEVKIAAVAVTERPRPQAGSYMPAFLVGAGLAKAIALTNRVPLRLFSHQENHILAGIWSSKMPPSRHFLALHVSGGTTEITRVKMEEEFILAG